MLLLSSLHIILAHYCTPYSMPKRLASSSLRVASLKSLSAILPLRCTAGEHKGVVLPVTSFSLMCCRENTLIWSSVEGHAQRLHIIMTCLG